MLDGRPAIAVLGPTEDPVAPTAARTAETLAAAVTKAGYGLVLLGRAGVAGAALAGAGPKARVLCVVAEEAAGGSRSSVVEVLAPTLFAGLDEVLRAADALILLPGDLQALALLLQVWAYGHAPSAPYRQVVLVGESWPRIVVALADAAGLDKRSRAMVTFAANAEQAIESVRYYVGP